MNERLPHSDTAQGTLPETQLLHPGQQSLAEALRVSFLILKLIMTAVVLLFLASGFFTVEPNEQALVLVFGKVQGEGESRIKQPGYHWTFPDPISEIIRIPVKEVRTLPIDSFWFFETEQEKLAGGKKMAYGGLNPVQDGYCLTRNEPITQLKGSDYNIVHSKWTVTYSISSPVRFFENVYMESRKPGESFMEVASRTVNPLIESLTSDAVVSTMVRYSLDEALRSSAGIPERVRMVLQNSLDAMDSGIHIDDVRLNRTNWPLQVDDAFQASSQAINKSEQAIIDARAYKEKLLTDTAGPRAEEILAALRNESVTDQQQEDYVHQMGGQVQVILAEAWAYRTRVEQDAKAAADYLKSLLPEYRKRPALVLQRLYQDAVEEILQKVDETIFVPPYKDRGREIRVMINRDIARPKAEQSEKK
ncbi:MAG TPA: protease modulator HflK [Anaerohalosphaeraceae bacterium]|nr:protease modulator HflK [Anaerohalosphaeraceae bacterium]HPB92441.1 protease modulator HflK [Anaerohalosphaeraceae bacterium]HRT23116.1 protease modulator HflK [Anaerohalosphaeraceae bacterium]HRU14562.1 protease modulator HflK [Anaerohalosphaeraceae bacterium]